jgi:hypothetical protein
MEKIGFCSLKIFSSPIQKASAVFTFNGTAYGFFDKTTITQ